MAPDNGIPNFTHKLTPFEFEGITFRRRKVDPRRWADVLERTAEQEQTRLSEKKLTLAVSAEGLHELVKLAIVEEQHSDWDRLREEGRIEWGELVALREWLWGQITERPFPMADESSSGPGSDEPTSEVEPPSRAETQTASA